MTSAVPLQRTISAGRRSIMPFQTRAPVVGGVAVGDDLAADLLAQPVERWAGRTAVPAMVALL